MWKINLSKSFYIESFLNRMNPYIGKATKWVKYISLGNGVNWRVREGGKLYAYGL